MPSWCWRCPWSTACCWRTCWTWPTPPSPTPPPLPRAGPCQVRLPCLCLAPLPAARSARPRCHVGYTARMADLPPLEKTILIGMCCQSACGPAGLREPAGPHPSRSRPPKKHMHTHPPTNLPSCACRRGALQRGPDPGGKLGALPHRHAVWPALHGAEHDRWVPGPLHGVPGRQHAARRARRAALHHHADPGQTHGPPCAAPTFLLRPCRLACQPATGLWPAALACLTACLHASHLRNAACLPANRPIVDRPPCPQASRPPAR